MEVGEFLWVKAVAKVLNLNFVSLFKEGFDLVIPRVYFESPPLSSHYWLFLSSLLLKPRWNPREAIKTPGCVI